MSFDIFTAAFDICVAQHQMQQYFITGYRKFNIE